MDYSAYTKKTVLLKIVEAIYLNVSDKFPHIITIVYKTYINKIISLQLKYCIPDYFSLKLTKTIIKLVFAVYNFPISSYTKCSKTQRLIKRNIIKKGMSACGRL